MRAALSPGSVDLASRAHAGADGSVPAALSLTEGRAEPPRVSRRLQLLRGWSHDEENPTVFP